MVRVTILGSGDAFGSGGRLNSAYLVEAPGATFLVDAGPTVLQGLKAAGCDTTKIDFVLLTHLHGDHFGGVPFLFMEYRWCNLRTRPLGIYGPRPVETRVRKLFSALYEQSALEGTPFPVQYGELAPATSCEIQGVRVHAIAVPHAPELLCLGLRVEVGGRTLLFSGDTMWHEPLMTQARGVDLFLCDCTNFETTEYHLSYPEIAAHAGQLGCKRLVLTHLGCEPLRRLGEISLECARDGMTIEL